VFVLVSKFRIQSAQPWPSSVSHSVSHSLPPFPSSTSTPIPTTYRAIHNLASCPNLKTPLRKKEANSKTAKRGPKQKRQIRRKKDNEKKSLPSSPNIQLKWLEFSAHSRATGTSGAEPAPPLLRAQSLDTLLAKATNALGARIALMQKRQLPATGAVNLHLARRR
jgi:hypothetical protein